MIDIIDDRDSSFPWGAAFLGVDEICYLEIESEVWLVTLQRIDGILCKLKSAYLLSSPFGFRDIRM